MEERVRRSGVAGVGRTSWHVASWKLREDLVFRRVGGMSCAREKTKREECSEAGEKTNGASERR